MPAQWIRPISSPSERGFLPRLQDALTGKGADIFIGDTRHRGPRGAEWSRLPSPYYPAADALSAHEHLLEREGLIERDDAARGVDDSRTPPWARRGRKRFDPVSRTYKEWGPHWRDGPRDGSLVPRDGELRVARAFGARGGAVEAFGELRPWKRAFWDDVRWDDALPPPFPRLLPGLRGRGVWDGGYWVDGYDYYDDSYGDSEWGFWDDDDFSSDSDRFPHHHHHQRRGRGHGEGLHFFPPWARRRGPPSSYGSLSTSTSRPTSSTSSRPSWSSGRDSPSPRASVGRGTEVFHPAAPVAGGW